MCADKQPEDADLYQPPATIGETLRNVFSNWDVPLPFHLKLSLALKNAAIRARKKSNCCGNPGEPGC